MLSEDVHYNGMRASLVHHNRCQELREQIKALVTGMYLVEELEAVRVLLEALSLK